jgi:hypothetical protein
VTALTQLFDRPLLLALALLLPALGAALVVTGVRRRRVRLARLGTPAMIARLAPAAALRASAWRRALRLGGALLFAGVAFAGPRWGARAWTSSSPSTPRSPCSRPTSGRAGSSA